MDTEESNSGFATLESWKVDPNELTPEQVHNLGHALYLSIVLLSPDLPLQLDLKEVGLPRDSIPAERYVESFAKQTGINPDLLKRWTNTATVEIAKDALTHFENMVSRGASHGDPFGWSEQVRAAQAVAGAGLKMPISDHQRIVWLQRDDLPKLQQEPRRPDILAPKSTNR